ncbi:3-oxoacyl-[acyl-carrier protein] reductase [Saccharopolyspora lacisalsi]|uniref:3-oxoacyl-[acyl-carrier protein] reductase n=1 Tax=Halosaccharopolyspora lacisalsi TaxID=1000566 RepID=A0A839DVV0_9PSEU|nr:SDR family NAD(P)-dependent oxidoreductase [Halosaccharopolyspora lacisalsi]MBA8825030.1 3-oxoacyl-[acyl-carrier protein] reductase [Halosaccharopolyspora lacisalsi]
MDLANKAAIVTGSGQGLGLACARELARRGASVIVNDVDRHTADAAVTSITGEGGTAHAVVGAVGSTETAQALVDGAVERFGRLDVLVTNAGVLRDKVVWKMTDDDFDQVLDVHMRGTFTCVRAAAIRMREQGEGGRIICVGSPAGQRGNFGQTNYSGAKSGIVGMVRTWAMELARANVTVNAVVPVAATSMTETVTFLKPYVEAVNNGEELPPFARRELGFGRPADAAGVVAFLAGDGAAEITGQAIGIGGDRLSLWSHPDMTVTAHHDGGWDAEAITRQWPETFAEHLESVGERLPEEATAQ